MLKELPMKLYGVLSGVVILLAALPAMADTAGLADNRIERLLSESGLSGGLIVHAGCDDGLLAASMADSGSFLVHGLVRDPARLDAVRADLRKRGLCGRATAVVWDGGRLPYADHSVNLLLVSDAQIEMPAEELDRVLAPGGMAFVKRDGEMATYRQPWPDDIDHWTHARYDATGNPTSRDTRVGPPRYMQWYAEPRWNRSVKTSSMVSAGGRVFYILDDSHFAARERSWALIRARSTVCNSAARCTRRVASSWKTTRWFTALGRTTTSGLGPSRAGNSPCSPRRRKPMCLRDTPWSNTGGKTPY
jgi:hypothetical protein